jgi:aminoglycoside phosphotransferase (APT) family kinase protein
MDDKTDGEILRSCLKRIMEDVFHERSPIMRIHPRLSNYSSSFASYIISVQVAGNPEHTIFMKDLSDYYSDYRKSIQQLQDRRNTELLVYREVLRDAGLGTAKYYGSLLDESQERFWLFLEFVDGKPIKQTGFEHWPAAVQWLVDCMTIPSKMPSYWKGAPLPRHDHHFPGPRKRHTSPSPDFPRTGRSACPHFAWIYPAGHAMASQPAVLVHGSYSQEQILLGQRTQPPRLCPVDWETAALGANLFDLAYLADGFTSPHWMRS